MQQDRTPKPWETQPPGLPADNNRIPNAFGYYTAPQAASVPIVPVFNSEGLNINPTLHTSATLPNVPGTSKSLSQGPKPSNTSGSSNDSDGKKKMGSSNKKKASKASSSTGNKRGKHRRPSPKPSKIAASKSSSKNVKRKKSSIKEAKKSSKTVSSRRPSKHKSAPAPIQAPVSVNIQTRGRHRYGQDYQSPYHFDKDDYFRHERQLIRDAVARHRWRPELNYEPCNCNKDKQPDNTPSAPRIFDLSNNRRHSYHVVRPTGATYHGARASASHAQQGNRKHSAPNNRQGRPHYKTF